MKNALKLSALSCVVLAGCGGSGGNAALSKTFTYGSAQAPSSSENAAASSAQSNLSGSADFASSPDATKGLAIALFADSLSASMMGDASVPGRPRDSDVQRFAQRAATSACGTVSGKTVTFTNCTQTESGFSMTLNGSVTATTDSVTWSLTGNFTGTEQNVTFNLTTHMAGTFTVAGNKINGHATSDFGGNVSSQGQNVSFGLATAALVDLSYQSSPYCITSGSVEVKRVWTQKPQGASGASFADAAAKITWTGCNALTVAHSQ